ncbi:MAG: hypothetical protein NWE89_14060 [Candidatus Bathyarchaeota archaeon]|nr:hypothetical protein [Candidatus Bathyarchaeota archaeon]
MKLRSSALILVILSLVLIETTVTSTVSAELNPYWERNYGIDREEVMYRIREMDDGGFLCLGYRYATSGYGKDMYIVRTDYDGRVLWENQYGGRDHDFGYAILRARDGNFVTIGSTSTSTSYDRDVFIVKFGYNGNLIWEREVRSSGYDEAYSAVRSTTGDMFIAGSTSQTMHHIGDAMLMKTDPNGNLLWRKKYGGILEEDFRSIIATPDGGYLLAGMSQSYGNMNDDVFLVKTDSDGKLLWNKTYGGDGNDRANEIIKCSDGNYLMIGSSDSFTNGEHDIYLVKVDFEGNQIWDTYYGGDGDDFGNSAIEDRDSNIIVTGTTFSYGAGSADAFVMKIDTNGEEQLFETVGSVHYDSSNTIVSSFGKEYVLGGHIGVHVNDFYLVKFSLTQQTLQVESEVGDVYGSGTYYRGGNVTFGVTQDVVYEGNETRYVFEEWSSEPEIEESVQGVAVNITLMDDVTMTAEWIEQHFVAVSSTGQGNVTGGGWFEEGSVVEITAKPSEGYYVSGWVGTGEGSYTGDQQNISITVLGPVAQVVEFNEGKPVNLDVVSPYGDVTAPSIIDEGSTTLISIEPTTVVTGTGVRYVFNGWVGEGVSSMDNPLELQVNQDTTVTASWIRQFQVIEAQGAEAGLSGWFNEGTALSLSPREEGMIPKRVEKFFVNGEPIEDGYFYVNMPITLTTVWEMDYMSLAPIAGGVAVLIAAGAAFYVKKMRGAKEEVSVPELELV